MRIAIITTTFWPRVGGQEMVVHQLGTHLHGGPHEAVVFAPQPQRAFTEIEHPYPLIRFGWRLPGMTRFQFNQYALYRAFAKAHKAHPFDVINAHNALDATSYALRLGKQHHLPVVVTCHGADIQREPEINYGARLDPKLDQIITHNLQSATNIVAISGSIRDELTELVPNNQITSIPNGVNLEPFENAQQPFLRKRLGKGPFVLSIGRNVRKKAFAIGVTAFAQVADQVPDVIYVHLGRNGEPLNTLADQLGIGNRFVSLGQASHEEVVAALCEASIFFSPSISEAFPVVNIEAMAAGLPCVVTAGPGNIDSVVNGENGWIVPIGDEAKMAEALLDLLQNEARRRDFGRKSLEYVQAYRWDTVAQQYLSLFQSLIR